VRIVYGIFASVAVLAAQFVPAAAQQSASFRLEEHALNAGGRPAEAVVGSSANFRVTLESIAGPISHLTATSASFRGEGGFVPPLRPPGEVRELRLPGPDQLTWAGERSVGTFELYRDALGAVGVDPYGVCLQNDITGTTAQDPETPATGAGYLYLVAAVNRLGERGTLGQASSGQTREPSSACP